VQTEDKAVLFDLGTKVLPGIQSISTPWHTPGHSAFLFKSGYGPVVVAGDSLTSTIIATENPWIFASSDLPPAAAPTGRYKFLDRSVKGKWLLHITHATFLGMGCVTEDKGLRFHFHELRSAPTR
jgi:glyoxylase-like metal-dependent hydrolase (beta-lactamase superfamily II)